MEKIQHQNDEAGVSNDKNLKAVVNPFKNDSIRRMTCRWKCIMWIVGITLFPLRLAFLICVVIPLTLIFLVPFCSCFDSCCTTKTKAVATALHSNNTETKPTDIEQQDNNATASTHIEDEDEDDLHRYAAHSSCRSCAVYPLRLMARLALLSVGYFWISIKRQPGASRSTAERPVVVANHTSLLDAISMTWFLAPMSVSMIGVKHIPVAGSIAMALQTIFVNRKDPKSKKKTLLEIQRRTSDGSFPPLMLYPEGTTTNGKCLVQFKKGAFTAGKPVQPIVMQYSSTCLDVSANGDMANMVFGFFMMMLQPYNSLTISLLKVHVPSNEEKMDAIKFANNVREEMSEYMGVPCTEHSYEDVFFLTHLRKRKQYGFVEQNFEMATIKNAFDVNFCDIKLLLDKFAVLTSNGSSGLTFTDFCTCLKLGNCFETVVLFEFFDVSQDGIISFIEFVRGMSLLSGKMNDAERLKLAFAMLDMDKDGKVSLIDLKSYLSDAVRANRVRAVLETESNVADPNDVAVATETPIEDPGNNSSALRQSSLDSCFDAIDQDSDGAVTFEEFVLLANERGTLVGPLLEIAQELVQPLDNVIDNAI
jgi:1-acyl-sn-glycerol-3-phosphate acyltransferase